MAINPEQLQELTQAGIPSDQLHPDTGEPPPMIDPSEAIERPGPSGRPQEEQMAPPPQMPEQGQAPQQPPEEAPEIDPQAEKFFGERMLSHVDGIRDEMDNDPNFKEGLAKSRIGPELISELAHWNKDRIIDLLKDMIDNPSMAQDMHDSYSKSIFHGRAAIEDWREDKYHSKKSSKENDETAGPLAPVGDETVANMDDESGQSAIGDSEEDFVAKMSKKR